jgi:hypothetical protein
VDALSVRAGLELCILYRLKADSRCEARCLARISCPVGRHCRYTAEQMAYYYGVSLETLREWKARG